MISDDKFLLQLLQDKEILDPKVIDVARKQLQSEGVSEDSLDSAILNLLVEKNYLTYDVVANVLAEEFNIEQVDISTFTPDEEMRRYVSRRFALDRKVFPISMEGEVLRIAIIDPLDLDPVEELSNRLRKSVETYLTTIPAIEDAIARYYKESDAAADDIANQFAQAKEEGNVEVDIGVDAKTAKSAEDAPIIKYVQMVITEAIKRRASDIHMEPLEKRFRVRYRVDGVLQEVENPPKRLQPSIVSRLKIMANVSIAEKRIPQDGRINIKVNGKSIDLRVSVLPTAYGESIVMRILDKEGLKLGLPQLGFFSDDQTMFEKLISMPDGVFLVTGPTGSGKSTTLYSALNYINKPDRKIITVEDPVEYEMSGINQVQVRRDVGMTFAAALRAMLRQAPNIIMIGEIRDLETAEIAVQASLTGHMVYSTLHTNDAPGAVTRLVDIGVKPYLVSAALRGVLAQRLIRKICSECKQPYIPSNAELMTIGLTESDRANANFMIGGGCTRCTGRGYRGRIGLFELFVVNEEIQQMVYENATLVELRQKTRELGMRSMREDGIRKITAGLTTIAEVISATVGD